MPDDVDNEETVENVRSGDGQDEIAGVGEMEGEGEESRTGGAVASNAAGSSIATLCVSVHAWNVANA